MQVCFFYQLFIFQTGQGMKDSSSFRSSVLFVVHTTFGLIFKRFYRALTNSQSHAILYMETAI